MTKRIITAVVAFPIFFIFMYLGGYPLAGLLAVLAFIGMDEMNNALQVRSRTPRVVASVFAVIYAYFLSHFVIMFFVVSMLLVLVARYGKTTVGECAAVVFTFFYVPFLMYYIYLTRAMPFGIFSVWLIFICSWISDTGAYFVGKNFGKHKLTPKLSPHKTIEGAIGGVVCAAVLAFLYASILLELGKTHDMRLLFTITGVFGSALSQLGDLAASSIKRQTGIKDYGKLLPGHGGVVDRFDSVLLSAPIVYAILSLSKIN
ncbi:phosphatidate cytidylyltransferase [Clostridia bacterium]|nr:phosphatidate cytidylyltransferase [Clostridia bacterium]